MLLNCRRYHPIADQIKFKMYRLCAYVKSRRLHTYLCIIIPIIYCYVTIEKSKAWTKAVKRTRMDWKDPTKCSVLCSEHFSHDCFEQGPLLRAQMGIPTKRRLVLKNDAVPTIFHKPGAKPQPAARSAFSKRERKRVRKAMQGSHIPSCHSSKKYGRERKNVMISS